MADDRLTVIGQIKFDKKPFLSLDKGARVTERIIKGLEKNTERLGLTSKKTSKNLNKMLDNYTVRIKKAEKSSNGMISKLAGLAAGVVTLGAAFQSVSLASEMKETQNKLNIVFGDMANDANKWSENYAKTMGFSVLRTKEAMGDIQNLFTGFGMGRQESSAMSKEIIKLANDLDSFNNLTAKGVNVQKTMISALMGETEAAKTLGASILETNLNIASAEMGLGKYSSKMKESTKIQIRLHAIQMQSKDAIGDVARNLGTEVEQRRRLIAEIENQKIALGQKLMPVWMKTLSFGLKFIKVIEDNSSTLSKMADTVGSVIGGLTSFVGLLAGTSVQSRILQGVVGTLTGAYLVYKGVALTTYAIERARTAYKFAKTIPSIFMENSAIIKNVALLAWQKTALLASFAATKIMTAGQWALNVALNANPIGLIVGGLALLAGGFVLAYKKIEPFRELIDKLWATMKKFGGKAIEFIFGKEDRTTETTGSKVPAFAKGTSSAPGGMALVGERGPELVDLPRGSSVFTNSETKNVYNNSNSSKSSSKGTNVTVGGDTFNITINGAMKNGKEIYDEIKSHISADKKRSQDRLIASLVGG